jgi:cytosine/adenosine deaminase-related metal-dependent hydrolase
MFVNAHTHLYSGLAPLGMPQPEPPPENFVQILERIWWRLDRALDEASLRAGARYYVAQARRAGTMALVDHHESPNFIEGSLDVLADACVEFGLAAVLCYGATERNGGPDEARRGLEECRRFIRTNRRPRTVGVVGLHASFTVSDETIRQASVLCRELDTVLQVHLAEDGADVRDARQRGYAGPLQRLMALDALPAGSILVHGVHLSPEEVKRASDAGCWFVQNPRSNRGNRVGYPAALAAAARVALGTDGFPSNMRDEAEVLAEVSATAGEPPALVAGRLEAGWDLMAARLGFSRDQLRAASTLPAALERSDTIESEAREQASRLWARW